MRKDFRDVKRFVEKEFKFMEKMRWVKVDSKDYDKCVDYFANVLHDYMG